MSYTHAIDANLQWLSFFFLHCKKKHIKVQQFQQEQRALRSNWIEIIIIQVVSKDENVLEWFSLLNPQL